MSYYISKIFQGFKITVGVIGGLTSLTSIIYGSVAMSSGGVPFIIVGGIFLAQSLIILADNTKALEDLKKYVGNLGHEISTLQNNIRTLYEINENLKITYEGLKNLYDKANISIKNLEATEKHYKEDCEKLDGQVKELLKIKDSSSSQLATLKFQTAVFKTSNLSFKEENAKLKEIVKESEAQLKRLNELTMKYEKENVELEENILKLKDETDELKVVKENLRKNNEELKELNKQSNMYIDVLRKTQLALADTEGDLHKTTEELLAAANTFSENNQHLGVTEENLRNLTKILQEYMNKLLVKN
jgi:chromosome segregation ATPase